MVHLIDIIAGTRVITIRDRLNTQNPDKIIVWVEIMANTVFAAFLSSEILLDAYTCNF